MARILLVNQPLVAAHTLRRLFPHAPPLTLQILSAALRAHGHETRVLDHQDYPMRSTPLAKVIEGFKPDVIGFSSPCMVDAEAVRALIRLVRTKYPGVKVVAGGQVPTFLPEFYLGEDGAHAVVRYEGEATFPELVSALMEDRPLDKVEGIAFLRDGKLVQTPDRPPVDLDVIPLPDRTGTLRPSPYFDGLAATLEAGRGCPYNCSFCSIPGFFRKPIRKKSVPRLMEEMRALRDLGVVEIFFTDDCFGADVDYTCDLAESMLHQGFRFHFGVQIRADTVARHPEMIRLLRRAGLFWAVVGFESYRQEALIGVEKGGHSGAKVNREASRILRELGITIMGTHIFGAPNSGLLGDLATLIHGRRNSDLFRMTIYTPLLGSKLYRRLEEQGSIIAKSLSDFSYGNYVIRDRRHPKWVQAGFFAALLAHYLAPDTIISALYDQNKVLRTLQRHAYRGAFAFVLGSALSLVRRRLGLEAR